MRLLFVAPYVPNALRTRPYYFLRTLVGRHQITLLVPVFNAQEQRDAAELQRMLPGLEVVTVNCPKIKAIAHSLLALPQRLPMQARYCYNAEMLKVARQLVATHNFEAAHVEHFRAAYIGKELSALGLPVIYDAVDCISLLVERTLTYGSLKNRLISRVELAATRRYEAKLPAKAGFQAVCATSREDAKALEDLAGLEAGKIKVISNGVAAKYFSPQTAPREAATVIFSGKMSYHANAAAARYLVSQIWPLVRQAVPHARLWIVGSNPPNDLTALSGKNGIEVTGYVANIADYLQRATLAVAPMVYSVGIQNKVLEAMACATPIVATEDVTRSIEARHRHELYLAKPQQAAEFAAQVIELLQNPVKARAIGERGQKFVATNYSWEKAAQQLEELWAAQLQPTAAVIA